jgi:hypothetical protein
MRPATAQKNYFLLPDFVLICGLFLIWQAAQLQFFLHAGFSTL